MKKRRGFTLLEMILAMAIGLVLLSALYVTMNSQLSSAQAGRDVLQEGTLARALLSRMSGDILGNLGPLDPKVLPDSSASSSSTTDQGSTSSGSTSSGSTGSDTSSGSTTSGSSDSSSTSSSSMSSSSTPVSDGTTVHFNVGVFGTANMLVLSISKAPRKLPWQSESTQTGISDLQRVTYWMVADGDKAGLARLELSNPTTPENDSKYPDVSNPGTYIIAPEVRNVTFQYYDGSGWVDSWDGSAAGADGETPQGPPSAIAITLELRRVVHTSGEPTEQVTKYRHVVQIPSGNNFPQPQP